MQALNLNLINQAETEPSGTVRKTAVKKDAGAKEVSFRDMVESASKEKSASKNVPAAKKIRENQGEKITQTENRVPCEETSGEIPAEKIQDESVLPAAFKKIAAEEKDDLLTMKNFLQEKIPLEQKNYPAENLTENSAESAQFLANFTVIQEKNPQAEKIGVQAENIFTEAEITDANFVSFAEIPQENQAEIETAENFDLNQLKSEKKSPRPAENQAENLIQTVSFAAEIQGENVVQDVHAEKKSDEKKEFFELSLLKDGKTVSKDAPNLFQNIFTVTDERSVEEKIAAFKENLEMNGENGAESLDFSLSLSENARQDILSANDQAASSAGSSFQQMLSQQIQANAPDFVKAGNILLRDNDSGSINMFLKPESLGNVKINLHLSDNVVTGQITVHSREAFEAFRQNLDSLRQAFRESGFENASLNLSYAETSSGFSQGGHQESSERFFSGRTYGDYASSGAEDNPAEEFSYGNSDERKFSVVI